MSTVKERPILFSAPMVKALLNGTKTQTRRIVKQPKKYPDLTHCDHKIMKPAVWWSDGIYKTVGVRQECPYGKVGDRLWVKETWATEHNFDAHSPKYIPETANIYYHADEENINGLIKRPSIFMPRWASRILLEITNVRVEYLEEISEADAEAEGVECMGVETGRMDASSCFETIGSYIASYAELWDKLNKGELSWTGNPLVWVIEFKVI